MKFGLKIAAALLSTLAFIVPAVAQTPSSYVLRDNAGTVFNVATFTCPTGKICPISVSSDSAGKPLSGNIGTTNANGTAMYVQGVTGGVPVPTSLTGTLPAFAAVPSVDIRNINGAVPSAANPLFVSPGTGAVFNVNCTSGCSGGGGGGLSVPFGGAIGANGTPGGFKDGSGNFQALLGDVTNGQWVNVKAAVPLAVTGTFWQATQPISAAALPLAPNAATATLQSSILSAIGTPFQAGGSIGNTSFGISGTLPAFASTPTVNLGTIGTAATAANQTSGNASLSSIDSKTPALGQALAAASVPVILPAATITTLTPPTTITANIGTAGTLALAANQTNGTQKTQIVDGSGNVIASTSNNLNVQCANCSGSGVSTGDGATFTAGTSLFAGSGGFYQTTATANALTTGQQGMFQVTANRALFTNLRTSAGVETGVAAAPLQVSLANTAANATAIKVDGSAVTQPVSGTVTANIGTVGTLATAANQILTQAPIAPNTATATKSDLIGMQYNSTQATFTNGQQGAVQGTSRGALYVATGADTFSVAATLAAETTKVIGTTRTLGNAGAVVDFAGQNASSPANAWLMGGQFNTTPTTITSGNASPLQLDSAGNLLVNIKAGSSSGAVAQGSTTAGQTGGMIQAAVTTSAPTYTTATTNPLSMDTSGNLRVSVASAIGLSQGSTTSGQTGSLIMGAVTTASPSYTTAQTSPLSLDTSGSLRINCITGCGGTGSVSNASSGVATSSTNTGSVSYNYGFNGTTWDQLQVDASKFLKVNVSAGTVAATQSGTWAANVASATAPVSTMNSSTANAGVTSAVAGVFDDATPTSVTENSFGYLRMSANRNLYGTIRDAAGNERGANVDASNRLTTAPTIVSGAVASGAFASGSIASGAIAAGAQVDLLTMRGTKNAGTAAANSLLAGGVYNATPLTLTDTQQSSLQLDANGYLKISTPVGIAQGAALGSNTGSLIMGSVTTSAPTYTTGTIQPASVDTSGNLRIVCSNCSGSGATGTDQGTFTAGTSVFAPAGGFYQTTATSNALTTGQWGAWQMTANRAGFVNLRNSTGAEVGVSGAELFVGGRGTAGSAAGGVLSVQGVASMTPLLVNPGTAGNWGVQTQGSTTSGQSGELNMAAVLTSAPSYTTAQTSPLNMTTAGGLRVDNASVAGTTMLTGNGATGTGSQRVTVASDSAARAVAGEGATGSTAPTGAQLSGVQSGANMVAMLQASASAAINVSTATTTQLVALSGSTKIYVTSFDVIAGGTGNITFVYGTGTNCGTGTTSLTGAYNLTAQAGIAKGSGIGPVLVVPAGNALCVTTSAAVQMSGSVSYTQF